MISKELFLIYLRQAHEVAESLQLSLNSIGVSFASLYLVIITLTAFYYLKGDSVTKNASKVGMNTSLLVCVVLVTGFAFPFQLYNNLNDAEGAYEPFTVTFLSSHAMFQLQDNHIDPVQAKRLDADADKAREKYSPAKLSKPKNIVLIVVDALRVDKLSLYGYQNVTTPHLDLLNKQDIVRKAGNLHASCGESACGMQSLISSSYVHWFSQHPFTIHDVMRKHGYKIRMIIGGDHTSFYGMKRIYGQVDSYFDGSMVSGVYMNDDAYVIDKTKALANFNQQPIMLQFHLMSVHTLGAKKPQYKHFLPASNYRLDEVDIADLEAYRNYYDNGVLQADDYVSQILSILKQKGYLENSIVAITADHGEQIGEHGLFRHANSVYEELLRIPFVLLDYSQSGVADLKQTGLASQVDIAPTIVHALGMPVPETWQGHALQDNYRRQFTYFQQNLDVGLYDHRHKHLLKYWVNSRTGQEYVYDLTLDPKETSNVVKQQAASLLKEWHQQVMIAKSTATVSESEGY